MAMFKVWAPKPARVELALRGERFPMNWQQGYWWSLEVPSAGAGDDYGFCVDGGPILPDPRSAYQPQGVHGPSRLIDHREYKWLDEGYRSAPLASSIIYELHVGTFTPEGTFEALIGRLDYLASLGITHVELMPVNEFVGQRGWGYDGVQLFAPYHVYGRPDDLKRLVDAAHARGLGMILDVVYNHMGPEGNYLGQFGYYFTDRYGTPWGQAVNFDGPDSDEVRRFVIDNAIMWLRDYHFDGLRLDGVFAIVDTSAIHIMEQMADEVRSLQAQTGRPYALIAESSLNDPRLVRAVEVGGYGLGAHWNDEFHHALHVALTGEREGYYQDYNGLEHLAKAIEHAYVYDGQYSPGRRRQHGRPATDLPSDRFVVFVQNHDQVGNRASGDRLSEHLTIGQLKIAATLALTSPYVPLIFMGEEWGSRRPFIYFADYQDSHLREALRAGRCKEFEAFGWKSEDLPDALAEQTFERSKIYWAEKGQPVHCELLEWYRRLIHLRRSTPQLLDTHLQRTHVRFDLSRQWLVMERSGVNVLCNFSRQGAEIPLLTAPGSMLLASDEGILPADGHVAMPPHSVVIIGPESLSSPTSKAGDEHADASHLASA